MIFEEFYNNLQKNVKEINIEINEKKANKFYKYMNLLLEWNEKINLTSIVDEKEIILKHFVDSLTIEKYINDGESIADIGTGAGFPGIPLKIVKEENEFTLIDSLNKRIKFLEEVINNLELKNIKAVHERAEIIGHNAEYREKFDIVTSRAVARLNTLLEYMLPMVKVGGRCICMKGPNIKEEVEESRNAIKILGGELEIKEEFFLPSENISRSVVIVKKVKQTPNKYPRKAGTPSVSPL